MADTDLPPAPLRGSNSTPLPLLPSLELQSSHSVVDLPIDQSSLNLPTSSSSHSVLQTPKTHSRVPPPPFGTPPKLVPVEQVMRDYPGKDLSVLRRMSCALAHWSIFGKDALFCSSLRGGGKNNTASLDKEKLEYIKAVVCMRIPDMSSVAYEAVWDKCKGSMPYPNVTKL